MSDLPIVLLGLAVILHGFVLLALNALLRRTRRSLFILDAKLAEHLALDPRYAKARGQSPIQGGGW